MQYRLALWIIIAVLALVWAGIWTWRNRRDLSERWASLIVRLNKVFGKSTLYEQAEVFFNEAAVLWAVFPLLDAIYDKREGMKSPSLWSILVSFGIAFVLFCLGLYCNLIGKRKRREEDALEELWKRYRS